MTQLVLKDVAMHANDKPRWSGVQSVKYFDVYLRVMPRINRFVWLETWTRPFILQAHLQPATLNLLLGHRPMAWEDVDQFVVTLPGIRPASTLYIPPVPDKPEWPRTDSNLHTGIGAVRWNDKVNLHVVFTTKMREDVTVWVDTMLERGELLA